MSILDGIAQMVSGSSPDMDQLVRERERERWFRSLQRSPEGRLLYRQYLDNQAMQSNPGFLSVHSPPDIDPLGR